MLIYEFSERTGYFPTTTKEWKQINAEYMAMPENVFKDEFCQQWVKQNSDKVRKQQEKTCEVLKICLENNYKPKQARLKFNVTLLRDFKMQADIYEDYRNDLFSVIVKFMQLKSFGFTF